MRTYWDAFVEDHPRLPDESDAAYLERFYEWLLPSTVPTKYQERIADLERQLAEAQRELALLQSASNAQTLRLIKERDSLKARLALAQEWATAYAALSSGRNVGESNRLELAYNAACERLYEALDAGWIPKGGFT